MLQQETYFVSGVGRPNQKADMLQIQNVDEPSIEDAGFLPLTFNNNINHRNDHSPWNPSFKDKEFQTAWVRLPHYQLIFPVEEDYQHLCFCTKAEKTLIEMLL